MAARLPVARATPGDGASATGEDLDTLIRSRGRGLGLGSSAAASSTAGDVSGVDSDPALFGLPKTSCSLSSESLLSCFFSAGLPSPEASLSSLRSSSSPCFLRFLLSLSSFPFLLRFRVPYDRIVATWPVDAASAAVFCLNALSFAKKSSMSPISASLSTMNSADLYCCFSFLRFSFRLLCRSSAFPSASDSASDSGCLRRVRRRRFFWRRSPGFLPSRSIGVSRYWLIVFRQRCRSLGRMADGMYHSSSSASAQDVSF